MTDYDALETRPLDFLVAAATDAVERVTQLERELTDLRAERDALLTLLRDLDADEMTDYRKTLSVRVKAALSQQERET